MIVDDTGDVVRNAWNLIAQDSNFRQRDSADVPSDSGVTPCAIGVRTVATVSVLISWVSTAVMEACVFPTLVSAVPIELEL